MKKVKHPQFAEAASWTNIQFWKEILEQCSLGKFPKGMSVSKNVIYINNTKTKKNIQKFDMPSDPKELCKFCKDLFTNVLELQTTTEMVNAMENFQTNVQEFVQKEFTEFKDASLKIQKEELIDDYIIGFSKEMSNEEMKSLKNTIYVGIHMGIADCVLQDNKISEIKGLEMKKKKSGWVFSLKNE